jgi:DNA-binding winged helix-turn-helix (wHTH) protein
LETQQNSTQNWRFGVFEVDARKLELRRSGTVVKLRDQPFRVLVCLLEQPGEIVSREDLRLKLWPVGTFVDFDQGLNPAVKKLRDALGDVADEPIYIETIPKRGYRFVAPVTKTAEGRSAVAGSDSQSPAPIASGSRAEDLALNLSKGDAADARIESDVLGLGTSETAAMNGHAQSGGVPPGFDRVVKHGVTKKTDPDGGWRSDLQNELKAGTRGPIAVASHTRTMLLTSGEGAGGSEELVARWAVSAVRTNQSWNRRRPVLHSS